MGERVSRGRTASLLLLAFCSLMRAQNSVSLTSYLDSLGTNSITVKAPTTLSGDATLTLPAPTGSTGCVQDSTGAGVLTINSCVGTPPVTLSASTTTGTSILTLTQSGLGYALTDRE